MRADDKQWRVHAQHFQRRQLDFSPVVPLPAATWQPLPHQNSRGKARRPSCKAHALRAACPACGTAVPPPSSRRARCAHRSAGCPLHATPLETHAVANPAMPHLLPDFLFAPIARTWQRALGSCEDRAFLDFLQARSHARVMAAGSREACTRDRCWQQRGIRGSRGARNAAPWPCPPPAGQRRRRRKDRGITSRPNSALPAPPPLQRCLVWDAEQRMTPDQALQHPWVAGGCGA